MKSIVHGQNIELERFVWDRRLKEAIAEMKSIASEIGWEVNALGEPRQYLIDAGGRKFDGGDALVKRWLAAVLGPTATASEARLATAMLLTNSESLGCAINSALPAVSFCHSWESGNALRTSLSTGLIDLKVCDGGASRPWLCRLEGGCVDVQVMPIGMKVGREVLSNFWCSELEVVDLLDAGKRVGDWEFPLPNKGFEETMLHVLTESTQDDLEKCAAKLLTEAQNGSKWSVPWGAEVEISVGSFRRARIFSRGREFVVHFCTDSGLYSAVWIGLEEREPWISMKAVYGGLPHVRLVKAESLLKLIAAAIVRDFVVVENRESVFDSEVRVIRSGERKVKRVVYLPRVKYNAVDKRAVAEASAEESVFATSAHDVEGHIRRVGASSDVQRQLAARYGVHLPEGYTFVRPHTRGSDTAKQQLIYRSRSASLMLFNGVESSRTPGTPAWFKFERDCASVLEQMGMSVKRWNTSEGDADGGIDVRAEDEDGTLWGAQCKCWALDRPVGPDVVRALAGALLLEGKALNREVRGILVTTSQFTSQAVSEALALGISVVDGARFNRLLNDQDEARAAMTQLLRKMG